MNRLLKPTRKMKDSGIEWIGEVPSEWGETKIKYITLINSKTISEQTSPEYIFRYVDIGSVNLIDGIQKYEKYRFSDAPSRARRIVKKGDVIVSTVRTYLRAITNIEDDEDVIVSTGFAVISPKKINPKYLAYSLKSERFIQDVVANSFGVSYPSITATKISNMKIFIPSFYEQQAIANFLDKQVGLMDDLIAEQKEAIEKWKEYKQTLITETVLKGLNPNAEMKDSGIEWIGKIPKSWEIEKIKNKFLLRKEVNLNEDALLLSLFTHIGVKPRNEMEEKGNKATTVINYSIVKQNDIIVNKLLAWMGAIAISDYEGVCSPDYDVYTLRDKNNCAKYYHYLFRTNSFKGECYRNGKGIMLMRLRTYYQEFKNIYIPKVPISEQQAIAKYLDEKCLKIDQIIEQKQVLIQQLEEYKQSLIYECVTGKRCVL